MSRSSRRLERRAEVLGLPLDVDRGRLEGAAGRPRGGRGQRRAEGRGLPLGVRGGGLIWTS